MIEPEKCRDVRRLFEQGMSARQIARLLGLNRKTVLRIVHQDGREQGVPGRARKEIDEELLRRLYRECNGYVHRVWERLFEEEKLDVSYPTIVRRVRELKLGVPPKQRCAEVMAEPGEEMQHDTTIYKVTLGGHKVKVVCSLLYFRYSKMFHLRMYRRFDRFAMKCFLHDALMYLGYCARICVIDNTNLARLRGVGKRAIMVPEMEAFSRGYGFKFICHEIGHANRKGGCERAFRSTETGFLPGRTFKNFDDLNQQALDWALQKRLKTPSRRGGRIPIDAFEAEKEYLIKVSDKHPAPYRPLHRKPDPYGYISFDGNYYWLPGTRVAEVKVLEYRERIEIFRDTEMVRSYPKPSPEVKNEIFRPSDWTGRPYVPKGRKTTAQDEERLRSKGGIIVQYLDYVLAQDGICKRRVLRDLEALSRGVESTLLDKALKRALSYHISDIKTLREILRLLMRHDEMPLPDAEVDPDLEKRPVYQEGRLSDPPDFSIYDELLQEENDEREDEDDAEGDEPRGVGT